VEQDVLPEALRLENVHSPDNVLSAYRAFIHALPAFSAGDHVTAFQKNAVYHGIHADPAQVLIHAAQLSYLRTICKSIYGWFEIWFNHL